MDVSNPDPESSARENAGGNTALIIGQESSQIQQQLVPDSDVEVRDSKIAYQTQGSFYLNRAEECMQEIPMLDENDRDEFIKDPYDHLANTECFVHAVPKIASNLSPSPKYSDKTSALLSREHHRLAISGRYTHQNDVHADTTLGTMNDSALAMLEGQRSNVHHLYVQMTVQSSIIEDLRRRVARLEWELDMAQADKAKVAGILEGRIEALIFEEQRVKKERDELESELLLLRNERNTWRQRLNDMESALETKILEQRAKEKQLDQQLQFNTAREALFNTASFLSVVPGANINLPGHEACDGQIATLKNTITSLEDQVQQWTERYAISVAEYENTIAQMAAKNVSQFLELDNTRDFETRRSRQSNLTLQMALDEQHARLSSQFSEEQEALRKRLRESMAEKDSVISDLQNQVLHFRTLAEQQQSLKDQTIANLQQQLDMLENRALHSGGDIEAEQLKESLASSEHARASLVEHAQQQRIMHENIVQKLKLVHEQQISSLLSEHEAAMEVLRGNLQHELNESRQLHRAELEDLEHRVLTSESHLSKLQNLHDNTVRELKNMHASKVDLLNQRFQQEVAAIADQYQYTTRGIDIVSLFRVCM